jgi:hypothetical protein
MAKPRPPYEFEWTTGEKFAVELGYVQSIGLVKGSAQHPASSEWVEIWVLTINLSRSMMNLAAPNWEEASVAYDRLRNEWLAMKERDYLVLSGIDPDAV